MILQSSATVCKNAKLTIYIASKERKTRLHRHVKYKQMIQTGHKTGTKRSQNAKKRGPKRTQIWLKQNNRQGRRGHELQINDHNSTHEPAGFHFINYKEKEMHNVQCTMSMACA